MDREKRILVGRGVKGLLAVEGVSRESLDVQCGEVGTMGGLRSTWTTHVRVWRTRLCGRELSKMHTHVMVERWVGESLQQMWLLGGGTRCFYSNQCSRWKINVGGFINIVPSWLLSHALCGAMSSRMCRVSYYE